MSRRPIRDAPATHDDLLPVLADASSRGPLSPHGGHGTPVLNFIRPWRALAPLTAMAALALAPAAAHAQATLVTGLGGVAGFGTNVLAPNDDGSSAAIPLAPYNLAGLCFFGRTHTQMFVNNNGNVTFAGAVGGYTPTPFPASTNPMMAPWWADVDTRGASVANDNRVYWDVRDGALTVTWYRVGYFNSHAELRNSFQLLIRRVAGTSDYDVEYRYAQLQWTTGDASGGTAGLGGTPAQAGFDAGDAMNFSILPGSRTAAVLNLLTTSNVTPAERGVFRYRFRGCALQCATNADCGGPTPVCDSTARTCRACRADADCGGSTPFCATAGANAGRCVQCLTNPQCGTNMCSANACVCTTNADCRGGTPICDTRTRQCRACDAASTTDCTGTTPVCGPAGTCVQCAPGVTTACRAPTPRCDVSTLTCVACVTNADCSGTTPYCGAGRCVAGAVAITSPVAGSTAGSRMPTITGTATPGQTVTVTVGGMTLTATANAMGVWTVTPTMPLPVGATDATATIPAAGGMTPSATVRFTVPCAANTECAGATPFCDTTTRLCRGCVANRECGAATPVCSMGACVLCTTAMPAACAMSPDGRACLQPAPTTAFCGCANDADCGDVRSGRVCDATTRRCIAGCATAMNRNGCPAGQFCTSADATVGMCTTTCNFDTDCAASMASRPRCLRGGDAGVANTCVECVTDAHCAGRTDGRTRCVGAMNTCAQCNPSVAGACAGNASGAACLATGLCGCTADGDCAASQRCDVATSLCVARPVDAGVDASVDVAVDASADVSVDVAADVSVDVRTDLGDDAGDDATVADAAVDAGRRDAGRDTGVDAEQPDADQPDAEQPDATQPDASVADADTGVTLTGDGTCQCATPGAPTGNARGGLALAVMALALTARRRTRR